MISSLLNPFFSRMCLSHAQMIALLPRQLVRRLPVDGLLHSQAQGKEFVLVQDRWDVLRHAAARGLDPRHNLFVAFQERNRLLGAWQDIVCPRLSCRQRFNTKTGWLGGYNDLCTPPPCPSCRSISSFTKCSSSSCLLIPRLLLNMGLFNPCGIKRVCWRFRAYLSKGPCFSFSI